tara:strand:+ start:4608 stop:5504 length:897 start_codon:yes stop_codon:yes gene_type:complete
MKKIVYFSGGVGGAKFAKGLSKLKNTNLSIIVNTGDDEYIHGVALSPDIDSVIYGLANIEGDYGWGIKNDKFSVHNELRNFYDLNFMIGDKDLALNLFRNQMLNNGLKNTEITEILKNKFNIKCKILPMSDDKVSTKLITKKGEKLNFQNYFVEKKAKPRLKNIIYEGSRKATVSKQVINIIKESDVLIIGPSNPILSIGPILSLNKINESIKNHGNVIAISPFIGKKALKGPSVENFVDMGYSPDIQGLKKYYKNRVNKFFVHHGDSDGSSNVYEEQIIFKSENDSKSLASRILQNE